MHGRSHSIESEPEDDAFGSGEVAYSASPPSIAQSPRSERSPSPSNWTAAHEQAAQDAYDSEMADHYIYDLTRRFASATKALNTYESLRCISELEQLPQPHQQSPWVLAMVGKAHYELSDYPAVRIQFYRLRA